MKKGAYILNTSITSTTYVEVLKRIQIWIASNSKKYISVAAVHLVMECNSNPTLQKGVNNSAIVTPDGMPLVWLSKLYGVKNIERVYGPTLMKKMCEQAQRKKHKIFLLGGSNGQAKLLKHELLLRFPMLKIVGYSDTPVRPIPERKNRTIIKKVNNSKANIVFIGMGCPQQELWMVQNRDKLAPEILIGVGAAFDFFTGKTKQAPVFIQKSGLEWVFRLFQEPRRLAYRYLVLNTLFIVYVIKETLICRHLSLK